MMDDVAERSGVDRLVFGLFAAGAMILVVGCGGDGGSAPSISNVQVQCGQMDNQGYEYIQQVQADVTDPDGDLTIPSGGLRGQLDSLDIRLTDEDADRTFTWSPSTEMGSTPQACIGEAEVIIVASDSSGNTRRFEEVFDLGGSESMSGSQQ